MITLFIIALLAYLLGAIPFGLIVSRWMGKVDITEHGSGNIGGTNVIRTVGFSAGIIVIICDLAKAIIAVLAARFIMGDQIVSISGMSFDYIFAQIFAACCAMLGHSFSIYIKFRGGKSVAVYYGSMFIIYPLAVAIGAIILIPTVIISRQMSRATILSTVAVIIFFIIMTTFFKLSPAYLIYSIIGTLFILIRHHENIVRLQSGTELKLDWRKIFRRKYKKQK
jgi:acyl phosphate:glycerol-3-phosphate acyltransferase